jgi:Na+-transporting NADH:ubiquinone oxidoreductase subunit NqrA
MLLGAGSVRRDCAILESVMQKMSYNYQMIAPKNNKTKTTAAHFKALTGWTERTNEHGRDAAMLVLSNYKQAIKMMNK